MRSLVRRLGRTVDDQIEPVPREKLEHARTVPDIQLVVDEIPALPLESAEVPARVGARAQELRTGMVVHAVDREAEGIVMRNSL
jgi:hypothetical protein